MPSHALALSRLVEGYRVPAALCAAAELRLADWLSAGPLKVQELARLCACDEQSLYRLLRALASVRVFEEVAPRTFAHTPISEFLQVSHPSSMWGFVMMQAAPWHWEPWRRLADSVRSGRPAVQVVLGDSCWERLARKRPASLFDQAMSGLTRNLAPLLLEYDLSACRTLVDVGGGQGALLEQVLLRYPAMRGVLVDRPAVIRRARAALSGSKVRDRVGFAPGDFFSALPSGGDVYLLKFVLHDWDDRQALKILKRCRAAATRGTKLLLIENVLPVGNGPHPGKLTDLEMMVSTRGGRERTRAEFSALLKAGGFRLEAVVPTLLPLSILVARPRAARKKANS